MRVFYWIGKEKRYMEYGYVRVSSATQNPDRQIRELMEHGISQKNIIVDQFTGSSFKRPGFSALMKKIKSGDVIFLTSFDRLGRNYDEAVEQWSYITKKKKTDIVILDLPILDTRDKACDVTGRFIADLVVQLMAYLADAERKKNKEAQRGGIEAKKARGEWDDYGRPRRVEKELFYNRYQSVISKDITDSELQKELGISRTTYYRYKKELKEAVS